MSHRITIKTEMTDQNALERTCKGQGWEFAIKGLMFNISAGPLARSSINMKTGVFRGDTDWHSRTAVTAFSQAYGEALWMNRIEETGLLESREVMQDGTVRLVATVMVA